jgi:hypothetical protein
MERLPVTLSIIGSPGKLPYYEIRLVLKRRVDRSGFIVMRCRTGLSQKSRSPNARSGGEHIVSQQLNVALTLRV